MFERARVSPSSLMNSRGTFTNKILRSNTGTLQLKQVSFGLPIILFHAGLLYRWSVDAFGNGTDNDLDIRSIVRCSFVMFCALGLIMIYVVLSRLIVFVQITAQKFVLPPDRVKMRRIVRKQVFNFTVFVFMVFAAILRSGTLGLTTNSDDGEVELLASSRAEDFGLTSPLNGVCGSAIWRDRVDIITTLPESWWFRMIWGILGYLFLTACFQLMPYTFMTVKGKWLEHRILILGLRTHFVRSDRAWCWRVSLTLSLSMYFNSITFLFSCFDNRITQITQ